MTAIRAEFYHADGPGSLYFSLELGSKNWKLAFTVGLGQKPRLRTIAARDTDALLAEIKAAKKRFARSLVSVLFWEVSGVSSIFGGLWCQFYFARRSLVSVLFSRAEKMYR